MSTPDSASSTRKLRATVVASAGGLGKQYQVGESIAGKYMLEELLGEGGMGAVWRAHNSTLDIDVAVKLLRAEDTITADGQQLGDRLLQEARAAAKLGHPAIARVFDFGRTERAEPYIVMELLRGEDLAQALARRGRISATKAVATLMPILHALAAAHSKGIVHRDIKPENIFLARAEDGRTQPKLVDFGIAKMEKTKNHRLTQTGTMLGSPIYMSPEQARGDDVDHLADVWAVCVVLYEMVAGRPPFEGKNYNALLYSIIADEPAPITSFGGGDDELWALLSRGFRKDPDQRWQSVKQLGVELARWMLARGVQEDVTGASLSAQWLRALEHSVDVLASVAPYSGPSNGSDEPTVSLREEATTRFVRRRPAWTRNPAAWIGGAALLSGFVVAFSMLSQAEPQEVDVRPEPLSLPATVLVPTVVAPQVEAPAPVSEAEGTELIGDEPEGKPELATQVRKPARPAIRRPTKKRLKNPFD